jgi:hypothetical protein
VQKRRGQVSDPGAHAVAAQVEVCKGAVVRQRLGQMAHANVGDVVASQVECGDGGVALEQIWFPKVSVFWSERNNKTTPDEKPT